MENKKPRPKAIGEPMLFMGMFGGYILGFREKSKKFIVSGEAAGMKEKEYENVFAAAVEILNKCGYEVTPKNKGER